MVLLIHYNFSFMGQSQTKPPVARAQRRHGGKKNLKKKSNSNQDFNFRKPFLFIF